MSAKNSGMTSRRIRQWHTYIGLVIAPSVLFFALTGIVQIFNLHEARGSYHPYALVEKLSAVHKDQVFETPKDDEPTQASPAPDSAGKPDASTPAADAPPRPADDGDGKSRIATYLLKWFFTVVSLGLCTSTILGIYMGITQTRRPRTAWVLLAIGTALPVALLVG